MGIKNPDAEKIQHLFNKSTSFSLKFRWNLHNFNIKLLNELLIVIVLVVFFLANMADIAPPSIAHGTTGCVSIIRKICLQPPLPLVGLSKTVPVGRYTVAGPPVHVFYLKKYFRKRSMNKKDIDRIGRTKLILKKISKISKLLELHYFYKVERSNNR